MDETINILILGDEGVGKSSIISTFISRHFPQEVPHVMIDVKIPRELAWSNRMVNIMDSSARINDRDELIQKILIANTIVAVYDVNRPETLKSIVEEWIPMVREVTKEFNNNSAEKNMPQKQIIIFGNKCDLLVEEEIEDEREKLQNIFEQFNIGILGIICSAMQLETIETAFYKALLVSACPVQPIYDPVENEFTPTARRAFLRIFRMFDLDDDNLLNDNEISQFQSHCFQDGPFTPSDISNMKRTLSSRSTSSNVHLQNNCVTFDGLLYLFREALMKDNYSMPWTVLQMCNYDEQLNFEIPPEVLRLPKKSDNQLYELSPDAISFLLKLARHAYQENTRPIKSDSDSSSDVEECLTAEALRSIFTTALAPGENHPWIDPPTHKSFWDAINLKSEEPSIPQSTLLTGWPHVDANVSFTNWINHWHVLTATDPSFVQILLHKLGYVFRADYGLQVSEGPVYSLYRRLHKKPERSWRMFFYKDVPALPLPRRSIKVCVLGDNNVGKSSFVWHVSGLRPPGTNEDVELGTDYPKPVDNIVIGGCRQTSVRPSSLSMHLPTTGAIPQNTSATASFNVGGAMNGSGATMAVTTPATTAAMVSVTLAPHLTSPYFISFFAIPVEHYDHWVVKGVSNCDVAIVMFQCGSLESLDMALDIEQALPIDLPRIFVGTKLDLVRPVRSSPSTINSPSNTSKINEMDDAEIQPKQILLAEHSKVMDKITAYTQAEGLPKVTLISTVEETQGISDTLDNLRSVLVTPEWGLPLTNRRALHKKPSSLLENPRFLISTTIGFVSLTAALVFYRKEVKDWMNSLIEQTSEVIKRSDFVGSIGW